MHLGGTNSPFPNSLTDSRKLSPLSRFHVNPAWSVFPAPEQVHLAPCITHGRDIWFLFPCSLWVNPILSPLAAGNQHVLFFGQGWDTQRNSTQVGETARGCFVHSVNLKNPLKTVFSHWHAGRQAASLFLWHCQSLQWRRWLVQPVRTVRGSHLLFPASGVW